MRLASLGFLFAFSACAESRALPSEATHNALDLGVRHCDSSDDAPHTWARRPLPSPRTANVADIRCLWTPGPGEIWLPLLEAGLGHSTDGGQSWRVLPTMVPATNRGRVSYDNVVWSTGPTIWRAGDGAWRSDDGGANWTEALSPHYQPGVGNTSIYALWGAGPDEVYEASVSIDTRLVNHTLDGGKSWSFGAYPKFDYVGTIWGSAPDDIYAGGSTWGTHPKLARIWHSVDHGGTWSVAYDAPDPLFFLALWGSGPDDIYAIGYVDTRAAAIFHSTNRGLTWASNVDEEAEIRQGNAETSGRAELSSVWSTKSGMVFVAGPSGLFHRCGGAGAWHRDAWSPEQQGALPFLVTGTPNGEVYALGVGGLYLRQ